MNKQEKAKLRLKFEASNKKQQEAILLEFGKKEQLIPIATKRLTTDQWFQVSSRLLEN